MLFRSYSEARLIHPVGLSINIASSASGHSGNKVLSWIIRLVLFRSMSMVIALLSCLSHHSVAGAGSCQREIYLVLVVDIHNGYIFVGRGGERCLKVYLNVE